MWSGFHLSIKKCILNTYMRQCDFCRQLINKINTWDKEEGKSRHQIGYVLVY